MTPLQYGVCRSLWTLAGESQGLTVYTAAPAVRRTRKAHLLFSQGKRSFWDFKLPAHQQSAIFAPFAFKKQKKLLSAERKLTAITLPRSGCV